MPTAPSSIFTGPLVGAALRDSFTKLDPRRMLKNPVMFTVEIGTVVMLVVTALSAFVDDPALGAFGYNVAITVVLLLTLLFANFAEAIAEARGKAQANTLRATRRDTTARKLSGAGAQEESISSAELRKGDLFVCEAGDTIPADGQIVEGLASIDEAAITGESAPVIREADTDRDSVIGGTQVLSDRIVVRVTADPGGASSTR